MGIKGLFLFYSAYICIVWITEERMYPNIMYLFKTVYNDKIWPHSRLLNGDPMCYYLCLFIFYLTTTSEKTGYRAG